MRLGRVAGSPVQWEQWRNVRLNKQGVCWRTEAALPAPPHSLQERGGEGGERHSKALNVEQHSVYTSGNMQTYKGLSDRGFEGNVFGLKR